MMMTNKYPLPPLPQGEYRLSPDSRAPTLYDEEMMEAYARAAIEADRKLRGVNSTHPLGEPECNHCGGTGDVSGEYPGIACPDCAGTGKAPQPAVSAEHATLNLQPSSSMQPVATAFFTEKGEVAFTGLFDRTLKALEAVKTTRMGISSGSIDLYTAPQPAEPSDSLPRHVAQTLATAIYETAQKKGIANGDHSALSVPQCLHLLDCMAQPAEPCASSVSDKTACGSENGDCDSQPAEPVKVSSDAISVVGVPEFDALMDHIYENGTASEGVLPLANAFARALLARYGQPAEPVKEQP